METHLTHHFDWIQLIWLRLLCICENSYWNCGLILHHQSKIHQLLFFCPHDWNIEHKYFYTFKWVPVFQLEWSLHYCRLSVTIDWYFILKDVIFFILIVDKNWLWMKLPLDICSLIVLDYKIEGLEMLVQIQ